MFSQTENLCLKNKKKQTNKQKQSSLKVPVRLSRFVSTGRCTIKLLAITFITTSPLSTGLFICFALHGIPKGVFGTVADKCSVMSLTHIPYCTSGTMCTVDTVSSCCGLWLDRQPEQKQEKKPSHILLRASSEAVLQLWSSPEPIVSYRFSN